MGTATRAARIIAVLIIIQMIGSALVNMVLEAPLLGAPELLVNAASHSRQIALGALLGLVTEALWVGIAVTAFPVFWQRARAMTLWLGALAVVTLAVAVLESSGVMSMVSWSQAYAGASPADRWQLAWVRVAVASARNWAHFLARICDGATILVFYATLYRLALVPRALAGFGLISVALMLTSVGMPLFGHDAVFAMLAPLGLSQLVLALWLITKGFRDSGPQTAVGSAGS
jgi:hypothetical protein